MLDSDGVLAGIKMRGLQAHEICAQGIKRRAGKGDSFQGEAQKLADGLHHLSPSHRSDGDRWS